MAVNLADIRNGIVVNLAAITDCQKLAYRSGNPTPPALIVTGFDKIEKIGFGSYSIGLIVQGLAGKALDSAGERRLDQWLLPGGDEDVWAALESDKTLAGVAKDVAVIDCEGSQQITLENGTPVWGTTWHVDVAI